jgi:hypothetical protein
LCYLAAFLALTINQDSMMISENDSKKTEHNKNMRASKQYLYLIICCISAFFMTQSDSLFFTPSIEILITILTRDLCLFSQLINPKYQAIVVPCAIDHRDTMLTTAADFESLALARFGLLNLLTIQ